MRAGVGMDGDEAVGDYSANGSPAQPSEAIETTQGLVGNRLGALKQRWKANMGTERGFNHNSSPTSEAQRLFGAIESASDPLRVCGGQAAPDFLGIR